jgi:hypothetical protein
MDLDSFLTEASNADISYPDVMTCNELYQIVHPAGLDTQIVIASFVTQKNIHDMRLGFKPVINFQEMGGKRRLLFLTKEDAEQFKTLLKGNPDITPYDMEDFEVRQARCTDTIIRIDNGFDFPIYCARGAVDFIIDKDPTRFDGMRLADRVKSKEVKQDPVVVAKLDAKEAKQRGWSNTFTWVSEAFKALPNVAPAISNLSFKRLGIGYNIEINLQPDPSVFVLKNLSWSVRVDYPDGMTGDDAYDDLNAIADFEKAFPECNTRFGNGSLRYVNVYSGASRLDRRYTKEYKRIIRGLNELSSKEQIDKVCKEIMDYLVQLAGEVKMVLDNIFGTEEFDI